MMGGAWKLTRAAALLAALALSSFAVTQPQAASRVCRQLEADLAAASRGGGGKPALLRKYDDAIVRQREQIAKASRQANRAGCGFSLFDRNRNACAALDATLGRMNANLDALQAKRAQLAGGGSRRDRIRILASLNANGCRDSIVAPKRAPLRETNRENGKGNLLDRLLRDARSRPDALDKPSDPDEVRAMVNQPSRMGPPRRGGEFRTMCVRTCDGYFFPMSNAASLGDFERDQKNCDSSCPGTEMQVFYTRGIGDDSADMTSSVTGRPYSELPTAYLYKQPEISRPPACGCNAARNFEIIAGNPPSPEQTEANGETTSFFPVPVARPDPGADPETLVKPPPTTLLPPEQRKVRAVGPAFLPDPAAATDPPAPAPKAVR
ncbi:hypothetical protein ABID19_003897 [Mesorhizobium robiniae]|uniref:DUF2865 domain-containing protein n=1 Tax=Mesorhizobium robiniae TaxID=559315 RepID=A0ABV2GRE1_9HYPH